MESFYTLINSVKYGNEQILPGKNFSRQQFYNIFLFYPEKRLWQFMQIVSLGDNFHEMSKPFPGKIRKIMSPAKFAHRVAKGKLNPLLY